MTARSASASRRSEMTKIFLNPYNAITFWDGVTVSLGILAGLAWGRRTGWSCGGIITPGLLALCTNPADALLMLAVGVALTPVLGVLSRLLGLYGRERTSAAMLLSLCVRLASLPFTASPLTMGWVLPGLIAADSQRQGVLMTVCGAVSCAAAASFASSLIRGLAG